MLVTAAAVDADAGEPFAHHLADLARLRRDPVAERAVGEAEPEALEGLGVPEAAAFEVGDRLGRVLERLVVVADDLGQQLLVVGVEGDGGGKGAAVVSVAAGRRSGHEGGISFAEDLDGVAERDAPRFHHPVDDRAALLAGAHAVPEIL